MADKRKPTPSNKSVSIGGDVVDSTVVVGDNNIIQKIINYIFPSEKETLEQRNRRILLGHVENAWIKGVLDASLHGAALLDLGIKQDPEAVTKYPWAIKKESTDETLPARTSMLEIFDSIGMGRSLLILGAPGSGKTTMLLELTRQLIARAREDVSYSIPMVFNLASWTEKLSLADWLAQELNNLYSVPRKTAPDWVNGNKLLLLLDGLDEVRQESRAKCVEAINAFRKEHGLTSLAVCSRSQDYADLNAKLSFEGAIEVQPLTQGQIAEFFNRFGDEIAGIKQALEKDNALREMAETPLFLSIMIMAYRDKRDVDIWVSKDEKEQRKHLFDAYTESMFERPRSKNVPFKKPNVLHWLTWLAQKMVENNAAPYLLENMQQKWLRTRTQIELHRILIGLFWGFCLGLNGWYFGIKFGGMFAEWWLGFDYIDIAASFFGKCFGIGFSVLGLTLGQIAGRGELDFEKPTEILKWSWKRSCLGLAVGFTVILGIGGLSYGIIMGLFLEPGNLLKYMLSGFIQAIPVGMILGPILGLFLGFRKKDLQTKTTPNQGIQVSLRNAIIIGLGFELFFGLFFGMLGRLGFGVATGLLFALIFGLLRGGYAVVSHYALRFILARNDLLPWSLVPFLDHCVDLIFLRRVGGGYIFVHRLLMEHFAEMYMETPTSKGN